MGAQYIDCDLPVNVKGTVGISHDINTLRARVRYIRTLKST